jgi:hypothetical protein
LERDVRVGVLDYQPTIGLRVVVPERPMLIRWAERRCCRTVGFVPGTFLEVDVAGAVAASCRRPRMSRRYLPALIAALLLAACGGGGGRANDDDANSGPDADLVAWMDGFCEARWSLELPELLPPADPITEANRQPLLDFLADIDAALAAADEAVVALPAPPTAAGNGLVESYRTDLEGFRSEMEEHAANAAVFPLEGLAAVYRLSGVGAVSFSPGGAGLADYLEGHADLADAFQEASACSGGEASTTSAS